MAFCIVALRLSTPGHLEDLDMIKRLTIGFALALMTAPALFAAPSLPSQATDRLPWEHLVSAARDALCNYLGLC